MKYKKPGAFNTVSVGLLIGMGLVVYALVCLWPVYAASSRAKGILHDHVPALYKANLRSDNMTAGMLDDIKKSIATELAKAGIDDKTAKVFLYRSPQEIGLEVRFKTKAHFPFPDKTVEFEVSPKVVSDATRVDW